MATKKHKKKSRSPEKDPYPCCTAAGLSVQRSKGGCAYISRADMQKMYADKGDAFSKRFCALYGVQTAAVEGPYPHDVEAVLYRMRTGRKTGTQLFFD
jgi:hypothetical protein